MTQLLRLRGRSALSAFRLNKLLQSVARALPGVRIAAEYWHFANLARALDEDELRRLDRLLTYGPIGSQPDETGELFLVVPRIGTISPWSSKATDIFHNCGLAQIRRVERGIHFLDSKDANHSRKQPVDGALEVREWDRILE